MKLSYLLSQLPDGQDDVELVLDDGTPIRCAIVDDGKLYLSDLRAESADIPNYELVIQEEEVETK